MDRRVMSARGSLLERLGYKGKGIGKRKAISEQVTPQTQIRKPGAGMGLSRVSFIAESAASSRRNQLSRTNKLKSSTEKRTLSAELISPDKGLPQSPPQSDWILDTADPFVLEEPERVSLPRPAVKAVRLELGGAADGRLGDMLTSLRLLVERAAEKHSGARREQRALALHVEATQGVLAKARARVRAKRELVSRLRALGRITKTAHERVGADADGLSAFPLQLAASLFRHTASNDFQMLEEEGLFPALTAALFCPHIAAAAQRIVASPEEMGTAAPRLSDVAAALAAAQRYVGREAVETAVDRSARVHAVQAAASAECLPELALLAPLLPVEARRLVRNAAARTFEQRLRAFLRAREFGAGVAYLDTCVLALSPPPLPPTVAEPAEALCCEALRAWSGPPEAPPVRPARLRVLAGFLPGLPAALDACVGPLVQYVQHANPRPGALPDGFEAALQWWEGEYPLLSAEPLLAFLRQVSCVASVRLLRGAPRREVAEYAAWAHALLGGCAHPEVLDYLDRLSAFTTERASRD
eukprot:gnl/Chilomastix_cuspidata/5318.p1 GENE.gnl/Chilomastix_cuspidata/5318~~gnl/Chilomastix_cuspidata/5318.p1  ORF type:complete len:530 (-),score=169.16 gnl/Chilomastix_cuspidata/5318:22-1611(-)